MKQIFILIMYSQKWATETFKSGKEMLLEITKNTQGVRKYRQASVVLHMVLLGVFLFCDISELLALYFPKCVGYSDVNIYNPQIIMQKYHFKQKFNI